MLVLHKMVKKGWRKLGYFFCQSGNINPFEDEIIYVNSDCKCCLKGLI